MERTTEIVPILPLTKTVFFPQTLLPLYIYEPRYQDMVNDCLNDDRRLAIGVLKDGWEKDYYGAPAMFKTVCVGHIVNEEKLSDGKYNIHVQGIERAQIVSEINHTPYRKVEICSVAEFIPPASRRQLVDATKFLIHLLDRLVEYIPNRRPDVKQILSASSHPGIIADQVAFHFLDSKYERQSILSEVNYLRRVKLVTIQVQNLLVQIARQHYKDKR